jgi:hypothetical protein
MLEEKWVIGNSRDGRKDMRVLGGLRLPNTLYLLPHSGNSQRAGKK